MTHTVPLPPSSDPVRGKPAPANDPSPAGADRPPRALADAQAHALGEFLRAHRERLAPESAGLSGGPRRRTPGLRREEVAQLCGVSVTWYTWIEQGRPVSASAEALARIANALRLTRAERAYLFELAVQRDPALPETADSHLPDALRASVSLFAGPAYVLDAHWNALAFNEAAAHLFVGWLDGDHDRSLLRFMFASDASRKLVRDWDIRARRLVAEFRADSIRHRHDPHTRALIEGLCAASSDFADFWESQDVGGREGGLRSFNHPRDGYLLFDQLTLKPAPRDDLKLVLLVAGNLPDGRSS